MKKEFYIFRHGESTYNRAGRIQGRTNDSVLTERGREQAAKTGEYLAEKGVEIIFASPLKRAGETAEIVNKYLNVPIVEDERFIEVNVGILEGLHHSEATARFGGDYAKWRDREKRYADFCFEGGETKLQVRDRVFEGLQDRAENAPYRVMAVASHGIMLGQLLILLGAPDREVDNGSILHISYDDGSWHFVELVSVNEEKKVVG